MMKIDPEGILFAALPMALTALLVAAFFVTGKGLPLMLAAPTFIVALYVMYFFRDPSRPLPDGEHVAVSAADGVVVDISRMTIEDFGGKGAGQDVGESLRIAVFMNVFNVHVNRTPLTGTVVATAHKPGKKMNAMNERAALENEYGDTDVKTAFGPLRIRQIAGLIARRVVTRVSAGDSLGKGDRIGLIRFGSRVDVYLPAGFEPSVSLGEKVKAGETVIARTDESR